RCTDVPDPWPARARRLVAARCIYGVDRDPLAVDLARLTVWLVAAAPGLPLDAFDHALRCGDSLLGLDPDAIAACSFRPAPRVEPIAALLQRTLAVTASLRRRIRDLAAADDPESHRERARILREVDAHTEPLRLVADLAVDAFFAARSARARETAQKAHLARITAWLQSGHSPPPDLQHHCARFRATHRPFHWVLEFPEIYHCTEDPPRSPGMDAIVGNPPFMAGGRISGTLGLPYLDWLLALHPGAHGNADLSAHFFRRADALLGERGTIALIATNTIGQGDTRTTGLQHLVTRRGFTIYEATRDLPWPEDATVTISIVHLARGILARHLPAICLRDPAPADPAVLLPRLAPAINSRLHPAGERPDPRPLAENAGLSFIGTKIYGQGFILTPAERDALIARDPENAARIFPYIGGDEVHHRPDQRHHRYVISFERMDLAQAEQWPDLLAIVRARVRPVRERQNRALRKKYWWRFGEVAPALYHAIADLPRCLVISGVCKHVAFSFQPTDRIFSHALVVLSLAGYDAFAVLQSRIHALWARALCSSMKTDLRYTPSDCFENFPFPRPDPRASIPELAAIGETLDAARRAFMLTAQQGLTATYNALTDPACTDPAVLALRRLHLDLDRAVLTAYGWPDLLDLLPPYTAPRTPGERYARTAFADAVFDRLLALNETRAGA
ncbi:MAG TPA: type IIL restriction-modification enzyme MmeI, partial [Nannocystis sp.]